MAKRKATSWNKHLMQTYKELKAKKASATFTEAMKKAKKTYKG